MALAFTTGTINEPDAGSVGLSMVEQMRDDIVAHAAWELVEEFTPAAGVARFYVFKCLGSANGMGQDFFVVLGRTLGSGEIRACIFEGYDEANHRMSKYPADYVYADTFDVNGCRITETYDLGVTNLPDEGGHQPAMINWAPSGTSTKWWLIVAEDGFTVAFNGASNGFFHIGAYTYLGQPTNDVPLQMISYNQGNGYITRNPVLAGIVNFNGPNWAMRFNGGHAGNPAATFKLGFLGPLAYNDKLQNNQRAVAEVGMTMVLAAANSPETIGYVLGKQKRMRMGDTNQFSMPAGMAFGDAFELNGTLWVPHRPDDARIWDTGVAG